MLWFEQGARWSRGCIKVPRPGGWTSQAQMVRWWDQRCSGTEPAESVQRGGGSKSNSNTVMH